LAALSRHPIADGGNAQRALPAARLRDHHPPNRHGPVRHRGEVLFQSLKPSLHPRPLDVLERHPVHARRAVVATGQRKSVGENVRPADLVVQEIEAELGLRLRLHIKLSLKGPDLIRRFQTHRQSPLLSS
jgi:hypothetical protein